MIFPFTVGYVYVSVMAGGKTLMRAANIFYRSEPWSQNRWFFCKKQEIGSRVWIFLADNHHQKFLMSSMAAAGWAQVGLREHKAKLQQTKETCFEPTSRGQLLFRNFLWVWWLGACTINLLTNIMSTEAILTCKFLLIFINITLSNFLKSTFPLSMFSKGNMFSLLEIFFRWKSGRNELFMTGLWQL